MKRIWIVLVCMYVLLGGCAYFQAPTPDQQAAGVETQLQEEYQAAQDAMERARRANVSRYRPNLFQRAQRLLDQTRQQHLENPSPAQVADYRQVQVLAYRAALGATSDQLSDVRQQLQQARQASQAGQQQQDGDGRILPKEDMDEEERQQQIAQLQQTRDRLQSRLNETQQQLQELQQDRQVLKDLTSDQSQTLRQLRQENQQLEQRVREQARKIRQYQQSNQTLADDSREQLPDADVRKEDLKVILNYQENVLFKLGSAFLSDRGKQTLRRAAGVLKKYPDRMVRVEGHTDTLPIQTSRYPTNWELSTHRAVNVLRYLVEQENIDKDRITAVGYGEYHPLKPNTSDSNRQQNRRVELVLFPRLDWPVKTVGPSE